MKNKKLKYVIFACLAPVLILAQAKMTSSTVNTFGGQSQSANFRLVSSAGQPTPVGESASVNFQVFAGFLSSLEPEDKTPPDPPELISTSPGQWSATNNFTVSWTNPAGDVTIAGAFYKIGDEPVNSDDGDYVIGNVTSISDITVSSEGIHNVYVWLKDLNDNYSHLNRSVTKVKLDSSSPSILHTAITTTVPEAQDIIVNATSSDLISDIKQFKLYYRETGNISQIQDIDFVAGSATIPASFVTQSGVQYYLSAKDSANNQVMLPQTGFYSVHARLFFPGWIQHYIHHKSFPDQHHFLR